VNEVTQVSETDAIAGRRDRRSILQPLEGSLQPPAQQIAMRRHAGQFAENPGEVIRAHRG